MECQCAIHDVCTQCLFFLFLAVKFGRMSKKQREKVEDEVRYHKEINNQQTGGGGRPNTGNGSSPDTTVPIFDHPQQPTSTDPM